MPVNFHLQIDPFSADGIRNLSKTCADISTRLAIGNHCLSAEAVATWAADLTFQI